MSRRSVASGPCWVAVGRPNWLYKETVTQRGSDATDLQDINICSQTTSRLVLHHMRCYYTRHPLTYLLPVFPLPCCIGGGFYFVLSLTLHETFFINILKYYNSTDFLKQEARSQHLNRSYCSDHPHFPFQIISNASEPPRAHLNAILIKIHSWCVSLPQSDHIHR